MKKLFATILFFIVIPITTSSLFSFHDSRFIKEEPIIQVTPLGNINQKYVELVQGYLQDFYGFKCVIGERIPLTDDILASSKTRYEASKIITKYNSKKNVLLLTDVDIAIFNKERNIKEYGIIGLGFRPGTTCVVSSFRIKKGASEAKMLDRLKKVAIHEIGHNLGLDHCTNNKKCLMNDKKGKISQIDFEDVWLCDKCSRQIGRFN
jgi:archaemetzincin